MLCWLELATTTRYPHHSQNGIRSTKDGNAKGRGWIYRVFRDTHLGQTSWFRWNVQLPWPPLTPPRDSQMCHSTSSLIIWIVTSPAWFVPQFPLYIHSLDDMDEYVFELMNSKILYWAKGQGIFRGYEIASTHWKIRTACGWPGQILIGPGFPKIYKWRREDRVLISVDPPVDTVFGSMLLARTSIVVFIEFISILKTHVQLRLYWNSSLYVL
jgi:hypothetical protein